MAFMEYPLANYRNHLHIRENEPGKRWPFRSAKKAAASTSLIQLEEEIHSLRRILEQMVLEGKEMTSDSVVELSSSLDLKINEYMNRVKKSR
jgi:hypothetical protein